MSHTHRFALESLLASLLLVVACGGPPDAVGDNGIATAGSGASGGGKGIGGSGAGIAPDDPGRGTPGDAGAGGDSGDSGPVCGNGKLEAPETCDDGNATPGDGCDGNCSKDANWQCAKPGAPCTYDPKPGVCGNGQVEADETCDLGADATGKTLNDGTVGCDATCHTVNGWTCAGAGVSCTKDPYCGDGTVQSTLAEQCDDGTNDAMHGCDGKCQVVPHWKCPNNVCVPDASCGNGVIDGSEQCDDHNIRNYDGCSATCYLEAGYACPATGGTCEQTCGNGKLDAGETCDDSNHSAKDGCDSSCKVEPGYTCGTVGQTCIITPVPLPPVCGNGKLETGELCDDGNVRSGDGCSSTCLLEAGWKCSTPGSACVSAKCGDGILAGNEQCDDALVDNVHGCSSSCTVMPNAVCPANGGSCVPMVCGDGKVTGSETCDSGLNDGKHGCSTTCHTVPGWICPLAGAPCSAVCGDGVVVGDEQCDEMADVPCCSASCKLKPGYVCDPSKPTHSQVATPYCGNGTVNGPSNASNTVLGSEQCDDGNIKPFDGCSPTCTNEPLCGTYNTYVTPTPAATAYQCFAHCGDGLLVAPEQCDDGNTLAGDGCDANCKVELIPNSTQPAWTCAQPPPGTSLVMPVIWRDFSPRSHPQFSVDPRDNRRMPNITQNALVPVYLGNLPRPYKYVPAYNTAFASPNWGAAYKNLPNWTMNGPGWVSGSEGYLAPPWMNNPPAYDKVWYADQPATLNNGNANALLTPAGRFAQWYVDDATVNKSLASSIAMKAVGAAFQYSCDDTACDSAFPGNPSGFFPLDGKGWVAAGGETARDGGHNYSFTTEMRNWFTYTASGAQTLSFYGDDDLWVFINGQLVLDIGGIHSKVAGNFTLNADGTATSCVKNLPDDTALNCSPVALGLVKGNVYEVAIFNAEREIVASNFQLTLVGFNSAPSVCTPICGDGFVAGSEQCDQGNLNVSPTSNTYGKCTTSCRLGPYCGDKSLTSPPETCDNGLNIDAYTSAAPSTLQCAPACMAPSYCGDHVLQKVNGEECDDGAALNQDGYGHCQKNCKLGARCGDGSLSNGEECDAGANNGAPSSSCDGSCKLKCGNGAVDSGEQCDTGKGVNGTAASACDSTCQNKCGNGVVEAGEQCDDGASKNDGSYNNCKADCTKAPSCGDNTRQSPPEICDLGGANSSTAYGPNSCTLSCLPGGFCGDGVINGSEKCDDGKNTGLPGSCKVDCSAYVPSSSCGDGKIQAPEKCDDGTGANGNGSAASKCDTACRYKCGNGLVDAGEQCDNGVDDGTYGTCTATCTLAGYCGDNIKNGNEQCDLGAKNADISSAYGTGTCTKACKAAPFCGDGKIQTAHEDCEGNVNCSNCTTTTPK